MIHRPTALLCLQLFVIVFLIHNIVYLELSPSYIVGNIIFIILNTIMATMNVFDIINK